MTLQTLFVGLINQTLVVCIKQIQLVYILSIFISVLHLQSLLKKIKY